MTMHPHSLEAYFGSLSALNRREAAVYNAVARLGRATERQILAMLYPGSDDMNKVRPRVTALCSPYDADTNPHGDWLEECGETVDQTTGKRVRVVRCLSQQERDARIAARLKEAESGQIALFETNRKPTYREETE